MLTTLLIILTCVFIPFLGFSEQKFKIIATTYPIYYPLKYMAEGVHNVDVLINTPSDHHHELKPKDLLKLKKADYVFLLALENWERQIEKQVSKNKLIPLYKDIGLIKFKGTPDPHIWVSPKSYMALVSNIYKQLVSIDSQKEYHYKAKFDKYIKELSELDKQYQNVLSRCKVKVIATTHLSASYLARDYGLEAAGIRGMHAEEEPRPSDMKKLIDILKSKKVSAIFIEPGQDRAVAEKLAKEVNAQILLLNTSLFPEKLDDDYFSIMKRNLESLKKGLQCQ